MANKQDYNNIGSKIRTIIWEKLKIESSFCVGETQSWLPMTPIKEAYPTYWRCISEVYHEINGFNLVLDEVLEKHKKDLKTGSLENDIFFNNPLNLIVEFDEKTHFNEFRYSTLLSDIYDGYNGFDVSDYLNWSNKQVLGGYWNNRAMFLNSPDPLFPENPENERQDNRVRQRAFRDFIRDITVLEKGYSQVVRIPNKIIGWSNRNNFSKNELGKIKAYLEDIKFWKNLVIKEADFK